MKLERVRVLAHLVLELHPTGKFVGRGRIILFHMFCEKDIVLIFVSPFSLLLTNDIRERHLYPVIEAEGFTVSENLCKTIWDCGPVRSDFKSALPKSHLKRALVCQPRPELPNGPDAQGRKRNAATPWPRCEDRVGGPWLFCQFLCNHIPKQPLAVLPPPPQRRIVGAFNRM